MEHTYHKKWICEDFILDFRALRLVKQPKNALCVQFVHKQYLILLFGGRVVVVTPVTA